MLQQKETESSNKILKEEPNSLLELKRNWRVAKGIKSSKDIVELEPY